jgi:aerobic C4-dicarboxylate transport protein
VLVNLLQPGAGMHVDPATLDTKGIAGYVAPGKMTSTTDFLLNIIPNSVVDAFAKGEILQVLLFSVLFGFALQKFGASTTSSSTSSRSSRRCCSRWSTPS